MAVCAEYKISHTAFLAWSQEDRDKAIWWHLRERERCPSCGTRPAEWDPEAGGDRRAYAPKVVTCRGCQQIEARRDALTGGEGHGVQIVLVRSGKEVPGAQ